MKATRVTRLSTSRFVAIVAACQAPVKEKGRVSVNHEDAPGLPEWSFTFTFTALFPTI
jgi:hypothetical protein